MPTLSIIFKPAADGGYSKEELDLALNETWQPALGNKGAFHFSEIQDGEDGSELELFSENLKIPLATNFDVSEGVLGSSPSVSVLHDGRELSSANRTLIGWVVKGQSSGLWPRKMTQEEVAQDLKDDLKQNSRLRFEYKAAAAVFLGIPADKIRKAYLSFSSQPETTESAAPKFTFD